MAQRTVNQTLSGATLSISASLPATYDASGYGATSITYTAVGQIENHGTHGMAAGLSTLTPVDTAVIGKFKGAKDYGVKSLSIGYIPGDAGQVILKAASESNNRYSVKISYPVGTGESTAEIHYLDVLVSKFENVEGAVGDVRKLNVDMAICRAPVIVAAT